ncbi:hypothetical protein [Mesorhizobium temperatum]|uniref:Uncharacterized protein n=1 Tax=Mesorhizobium temperatum TaxID=241416 RepID=A0A271LN06_9HYPH|nr:hypothetical protein [Mesorhizobium temperatum]PAQ09542.1 hypothetical protein CIT26_13545 [Mesorhizobium temperatum]
MNIISERDGLEMTNEHGAWRLYLVENDGASYTLLADMTGHSAVNLLSEYLSRLPKYANDNLLGNGEGGR